MTEPLLLSRDELAAGADIAATCANGLAPLRAAIGATVREPSLRLFLRVDSANGRYAVDGWVGASHVVWHVAGDATTPRQVLHGPTSTGPSIVALLVGLGPRSTHPTPVTLEASALSRGVRHDEPIDGLGRVVRAWTLTRAATISTAEAGITVVDQGPGSSLWAVAEVAGNRLTLFGVTSLDVWQRIADLSSEPSVSRGSASAAP